MQTSQSNTKRNCHCAVQSQSNPCDQHHNQYISNQITPHTFPYPESTGINMQIATTGQQTDTVKK